jgi:hypothetical protein
MYATRMHSRNPRACTVLSTITQELEAINHVLRQEKEMLRKEIENLNMQLRSLESQPSIPNSSACFLFVSQ